MWSWNGRKWWITTQIQQKISLTDWLHDDVKEFSFWCRTSYLLFVKPALCGIKKWKWQRRIGCGTIFPFGGHQPDIISGEYRHISHERSLFLGLIRADICPSYPNLLSWNFGDHAEEDVPSPRRPPRSPLILCFGFTDRCEELQPPATFSGVENLRFEPPYVTFPVRDAALSATEHANYPQDSKIRVVWRLANT